MEARHTHSEGGTARGAHSVREALQEAHNERGAVRERVGEVHRCRVGEKFVRGAHTGGHSGRGNW